MLPAHYPFFSLLSAECFSLRVLHILTVDLPGKPACQGTKNLLSLSKPTQVNLTIKTLLFTVMVDIHELPKQERSLKSRMQFKHVGGNLRTGP